MERILVTAIDAVLDEAGLTNEAVRSYVKHWAQHTGAERVEVINASDDARLCTGHPFWIDAGWR